MTVSQRFRTSSPKVLSRPSFHKPLKGKRHGYDSRTVKSSLNCLYLGIWLFIVQIELVFSKYVSKINCVAFDQEFLGYRIPEYSGVYLPRKLLQISAITGFQRNRLDFFQAELAYKYRLIEC
jgi:hypothetical protein